MDKIYSKKSKKFLNKTDPTTRNKIEEAIRTEKNMMKLAEVKQHKGKRWRIKLEHYRVVLEERNNYMYVASIDTKTNMKKNKHGYF